MGNIIKGKYMKKKKQDNNHKKQFESMGLFDYTQNSAGLYINPLTNSSYDLFRKLKILHDEEKYQIFKDHQLKISHLYKEIEHGDEEHRYWLKTKIEDFFGIKVI